MATDYGGTHGGQPWPGAGAQPPYPGRPDDGGQPAWGPSSPDADADPHPHPHPGLPAGRRLSRLIVLTVLVLAAVAFVSSVAGAVDQVLPRGFTAAQRQQITNWEYAKRWRTLPAGTIFPATVRYAPPTALDDDPALMLTAKRVGIARQASCSAATDRSAARVLDRNGCTAVLRATYVDATDSYVLTVGAAVLPGAAPAAAAARAITAAPGAGGLGPTVHTLQFAGTPAAAFTNRRRQLSGVFAAGPYVVLYTVGYTDDRPVEPVASDVYTGAEMTSAGAGVAHAVLSVLAAAVPSPHCPGTPGC